jgi:hypothetical protein
VPKKLQEKETVIKNQTKPYRREKSGALDSTRIETSEAVSKHPNRAEVPRRTSGFRIFVHKSVVLNKTRGDPKSAA